MLGVIYKNRYYEFNDNPLKIRKLLNSALTNDELDECLWIAYTTVR